MPVSAKRSGRVPYWQSECGRAVVYVGDCLRVMSHLDRDHFHAVVTDPPYGLEFMGKEWDAPWKHNGKIEVCDEGTDASHPFRDGSARIVYGRNPSYQVWFHKRASIALNVAKPGANLLSFGGTRMWHRMACAVEDAGWEIRDTVMWVYGCLSADTEILTKNGWRRYDQIAVGDIVAAWDSKTSSIQLESVEAVTVAPYTGKMVKFANDNTDQLLTPNHRVYKKHAQRFRCIGIEARWFDERWNVSEAGRINRWQPIKLPLSGYHNGNGVGGEDYAELLGWVFTEGGFDTTGTGVRITQSSVNADKVKMIDDCLVKNDIKAKHYQREREYKGRKYVEHTWFFTGPDANKVRDSLPNKHPTWELLWSMTIEEKRAFYNSSMLGDGSGMDFYQKDDADREWFQTLLHCIGMQGRDNPNKYVVACHDNSTTELQKRHLKNEYEEYSGIVWCVYVPSSAFVARRNGKVFITGNSGFPKSHDVSKAIDKILGAERVPSRKGTAALAQGQFNYAAVGGGGYGYKAEYTVGDPVTPEAQQWDGWGSALKPAYEPIIVARKPLDGTLAHNTLTHGCGGLNIDGCRVGTDSMSVTASNDEVVSQNAAMAGPNTGRVDCGTKTGRWPANLIHDGSDEVVGSFNGGSAACLFYTAKADSSDRPHGKVASGHPTVKPLDLMRYLVRLVCAPGGIVLDPFMGSGSTGCAAILEGMRFVGIEQSEEYADLAIGRLKLALTNPTAQITSAPSVQRLRGT